MRLRYIFGSVRARAVVASSGLDVVAVGVVALLGVVVAAVLALLSVGNTSSSGTAAIGSLSSNISVSSSDGG